MKKTSIVIVALLCVALVCGGFYLLKNRANSSPEEGVLTQVEKIITRNLDAQYPVTPREVVKFYNKIITSYYAKDYTDKEFDALTRQALKLFDAELVETNPLESYKVAVRLEVQDYERRERTIEKDNVCDSQDVLYLTDPNNGDEIAYVTASYFMKEENAYEKIYQRYVLRKDSEGCWKILSFYQIQAPSADTDEI